MVLLPYIFPYTNRNYADAAVFTDAIFACNLPGGSLGDSRSTHAVRVEITISTPLAPVFWCFFSHPLQAGIDWQHGTIAAGFQAFVS